MWRGLLVTYRLFLSHSSPSQEARARLVAFAKALEDSARPDDLRVLYDKEQIATGDDWRNRIAFMLHACHGGVVVLDEAALDSDWVPAEATFLSLRHEHDPAFGFLPVSFLAKEDLSQARTIRTELANRSAIAGSWRVVDLTRVQFAEDSSVENLAARVVEALRHQGVLSADDSPADRLGSQLAPQFSGASKKILAELAGTIAGRAPYLTSDAKTLAALAIVGVVLGSGKLLRAREMLDELGTAYPDTCRLAIIDELAPLSLGADSSALLLRRREAGGHIHTSVICEQPEFTIRGYIRRAHLTRVPPAHFAIANNHGTFEDLQAALRDEWRARNPSKIRVLNDQQVDQRLREGDRDVYVWVAGPVDLEVMTRLDHTYPRVAFIVHHDWNDENAALPPQLTPILPSLSRTEEDDIITDYEDAVMALEGWQRRASREPSSPHRPRPHPEVPGTSTTTRRSPSRSTWRWRPGVPCL